MKYHVKANEMPLYNRQPGKGGLKLAPAVDSGNKEKKWQDTQSYREQIPQLCSQHLGKAWHVDVMRLHIALAPVRASTALCGQD